jgi:hypothetical protein
VSRGDIAAHAGDGEILWHNWYLVFPVELILSAQRRVILPII